MKLNRERHPLAKLRGDAEGNVHVVDGFGDPWCEDEIDLYDDENPEDVGKYDMCPACLRAGTDDGLFE